MATSAVAESRDVEREHWIQLLEAMQVAGASEKVLRRHVALGAVRIRKARGGRYRYHRGDCERLREVIGK